MYSKDNNTVSGGVRGNTTTLYGSLAKSDHADSTTTTTKTLTTGEEK